MKIQNYLLCIIISIIFPSELFSFEQTYVSFLAKKGDKLEKIFRYFQIPFSEKLKQKFIELNSRSTDQNLKLLIGLRYYLPILKIEKKKLDEFLQLKVTSDSIDFVRDNIFEYNNTFKKRNINIQDDVILIPLNFLSNYDISNNNFQDKSRSSPIERKRELTSNKLTKIYYGKKIGKIKIKSRILKDCSFYLVSGHGGPDPGAIGYFQDKELHEDEYAYDITLRLAKYLEENGAKVFMITIDTIDGIRNEKFLEPSNLEFFYGGVKIPLNQKERLQTCVDILNNLYKKNLEKRKYHISVNIHLDSRSETEKVDVFYYYQEQNSISRKIAETLQSTFEQQYKKFQPNRGYNGTVESRNLFMLKYSLPPTVYIELGNIRNRSNQFRFIENTNREALAKWLCIGLINFIKKNPK